MKAWVFSIIGAVLAGGYEAIAVRDEWQLGSDHLWRAAGSITAFAVIGLMVGLVATMFFLPERPS